VLAIACLGVLRFNGPASKPSAKPVSVAPASLAPTIENELHQAAVGEIGRESSTRGNQGESLYGLPGDYSSDPLEPEEK
jgi:hypothetical protein